MRPDIRYKPSDVFLTLPRPTASAEPAQLGERLDARRRELMLGHHPTKIGTRWTMSRDARFELLDRLLEENHRRHTAQSS